MLSFEVLQWTDVQDVDFDILLKASVNLKYVLDGSASDFHLQAEQSRGWLGARYALQLTGNFCSPASCLCGVSHPDLVHMSQSGFFRSRPLPVIKDAAWYRAQLKAGCYILIKRFLESSCSARVFT